VRRLALAAIPVAALLGAACQPAPTTPTATVTTYCHAPKFVPEEWNAIDVTLSAPAPDTAVLVTDPYDRGAIVTGDVFGSGTLLQLPEFPPGTTATRRVDVELYFPNGSEVVKAVRLSPECY